MILDFCIARATQQNKVTLRQYPYIKKAAKDSVVKWEPPSTLNK